VKLQLRIEVVINLLIGLDSHTPEEHCSLSMEDW
jgi:hypothetical protein